MKSWRWREVILAGVVGRMVSGAPSLTYGLVTRRIPVEAPLGEDGTPLLPSRESRPASAVTAMLSAQLALSIGWAGVLAAALPRRGRVGVGAAAGLAVAAVELSLARTRLLPIRAVPVPVQVADRVLFGMVMAWLLRSPPEVARRGVTPH